MVQAQGMRGRVQRCNGVLISQVLVGDEAGQTLVAERRFMNAGTETNSITRKQARASLDIRKMCSLDASESLRDVAVHKSADRSQRNCYVNGSLDAFIFAAE